MIKDYYILFADDTELDIIQAELSFTDSGVHFIAEKESFFIPFGAIKFITDAEKYVTDAKERAESEETREENNERT